MDAIIVTNASAEEIAAFGDMPPGQIQEARKMFLFSMEQDEKTGAVIIRPMNEDNCITIHGADEAEFFIDHLRGYFRTE